MDGGAIAAVPDGDRLTQAEIIGLFGPMDDEVVWVHRDGAALRPGRDVPESDERAWRAAMSRGDADTSSLEWSLHDHGVSRPDVRARLGVAARTLDEMGVEVEWDADGLGITFLHDSRGDGVSREPIGVRGAIFSPVLLFDRHTGEAFPPEHVRHQAAAFMAGVNLDAARIFEATVFVGRHAIEVPAAATDGMTPWQREWVAARVRLGADGRRAVAFARDERTKPHCIYDGPDMDEAVRAIRERAARMEGR